jgi:cytoskeletal protein CcmA (bactofilin family)
MAELQEDIGFKGDVELGAGLGLAPGSRGFLTFDQDSTEPYSTNNFLGEDGTGWKRAVPDQTIHLVGVGESGGVKKFVEAVVYLPEYPVAVACDGPVTVRESFIGGFNPEDDREWEPGSGYSVEDEELEPGHLMTNSDLPNSIVLDAQTRILGDVQTRGRVQLAGATVEGEVRENWGREAPLPKFDLNDFDPAASEDIYFEELTLAPSTARLTGNVRYEGDLNMAGDLTLDNAFLFVRGDLKVDGQVKGVGSVVATGKVSFKGAVDVLATQQLALLSGGGIDLVGESPSRSLFRGLIYTKGPFLAKKVTLVGGFIVDNAGTTEIVESKIYFSGTYVSPVQKRETMAVVPRFLVPRDSERDDELGFGAGGLPIGPWERGREGYFPAKQDKVTRTVVNVLDIEHKNWARSDWNQFDPAVVSVKWVDGVPKYGLRFWGHDEDSTLRDEAADPMFEREESSLSDLAKFMVKEATGNGASDPKGNLKGKMPQPGPYGDHLTAVLKHLEDGKDSEQPYNFSIDPNEFVVNADRLRLIYYRKF